VFFLVPKAFERNRSVGLLEELEDRESKTKGDGVARILEKGKRALSPTAHWSGGG